MDLLKPIRKVVNKIKDTVAEDKKQSDKLTDLMKWKRKLENAKTSWDSQILDEREMLYNGTHDVDGNINSSNKPSKQANNVHNVIYEFIEAQVDPSIPQPTVKSKRRGFEKQAQMVEDSLKNDLQESNIDILRINDENERITPVQGFSVVTVAWNPDIKHHLWRGELELDNPHPKALIPQPGVYNIQRMDYFFLLYSVTKDYVLRRYGVELSTGDGEEYPEIAYFAAEQAPIDADADKVTLIVVYYKDDDGDIGRFTWTNETVIEDMPKFFYRRLERCTKCGAVKGLEDQCQNMIPSIEYGLDDEEMPVDMPCSNTEYKTSIEETEMLVQDVMLPDGMTVPAGTEVPYFQPTRYPVVVRRNVPVNFQLGGQSDVDIIRDQADAIKKIVSNIEEKILRGGGIITALDDHKFNLTNELYQIIRGSQSQLQALQVKNLTADIQAELAVAQYMYKAAQDTLGITNSWQGKEDNTAKSGVAKQIQVQQASGRMMSKQANKYAAFKELFETMFEFKLAYYDELRPYIKKGEGNKDDYGDFDKYQFLAQDAAGKWYYNTDFIFSADAGEGLPRDKMWIMQTTREMAREQLLDKAQAWTILETVQFPMAQEIKEQAMQEKQMIQEQARLQAEQQNKQAQIDAILKSLTPEEREAFMRLDPNEQQAMLADAQRMQGGGM